MSIVTTRQAEKAAWQDLEKGKLRIIRYDLPSIRTGYWDHHGLMKRFGVMEYGFDFTSADSPACFKTAAVCDAYNRVMDRELIDRYGAKYRQQRNKILPPPGSGFYSGPGS